MYNDDTKFSQGGEIMKKFKLLVATLLVGVLALGLAACGGVTADTTPADIKSQKVSEEQWRDAFAELMGTLICKDNFTFKMSMTTVMKEGETVLGSQTMAMTVKIAGGLGYTKEEDTTVTGSGETATTETETEEGYMEETTVDGKDVVYEYTYNETDKKWYKEESQDMESLSQTMLMMSSMLLSDAYYNMYEDFTYDDEAKAYVYVDEVKEGETVVSSTKTIIKIVGGKVVYIGTEEVDGTTAQSTQVMGIMICDVGNTKVELPAAELKTAA